jgi:hypothetical protein
MEPTFPTFPPPCIFLHWELLFLGPYHDGHEIMNTLA